GILAVIVGATMYVLQKIAQKKPSYAKNTGTQNKSSQAQQTEKTMKMVSYFMVIMMATFAYSNNALALYWVVGNIYSIGQTVVNRKINEKRHAELKQKELLG
ncbi:MAG: YidC/Oxa1 family membrane protein insertase, partial [Acholeplasmataceae bacterium]